MAKRSSQTIAADPALLYEILTDYEALSEWLPHVAKSRLLASEGDLALAELNLGDEKSTRCAMECVHSKDRAVVWQPVEDQVAVTQFQWELEPAAEGKCLVTAVAEKPMCLPRHSSAAGSFLEPEACLAALKNQAALFVQDEFLAEGCEKILEIMETESGLVCWLRGKKYRLVPEAR